MEEGEHTKAEPAAKTPEIFAHSTVPHCGDTRVLAIRGLRHHFTVLTEQYGVVVLHQSSSEVYFRGRYHQKSARGLMLTEPGEVLKHRQVPMPEFAHVIMFDTRMVEHAAEELGMPSSFGFRRTLWHDPKLYDELAGLLRSLADASSIFELQASLSGSLVTLLRETADVPARPRTSTSEPRAVRRAREFLHAHYADAITLRDLAKAAGLNTSHLLRAFSQEVGLPPHAYLIQLRLCRAREMLVAGERPADVATALGFFDQTHFSRHFKRALGISPGAYARGACAACPSVHSPCAATGRFGLTGVAGDGRKRGFARLAATSNARNRK